MLAKNEPVMKAENKTKNKHRCSYESINCEGNNDKGQKALMLWHAHRRSTCPPFTFCPPAHP